MKTNSLQPALTDAGTLADHIRSDTPYPKPRRRSDLSCRTIDGEMLILNRAEKRLHQLNPTASFIWNCCDGDADIAAITDRLTTAYEIDVGTARKDVEEVLSQLRSSNLLEE